MDHVLKAAATAFDSMASTKIADLEREYARKKSKLRLRRLGWQSPFRSSSLGVDPSECHVTSPSEQGLHDDRDNVQSVKKLHKQIRARSLSGRAFQHRLESETILAFLKKDLEERASLEVNRMERDQQVEMELLRRDITTFYDRQLRNLHLEVLLDCLFDLRRMISPFPCSIPTAPLHVKCMFRIAPACCPACGLSIVPLVDLNTNRP